MKKVILLNGSAGIGKTTISKMYTKINPFSISIESDLIIGMIGSWRNDWSLGRKIVFEHTKAILETHLKFGYDVVLPFILTDNDQANQFQEIAEKNNAKFYEIILFAEKEEALSRLIERGRWGEEDSGVISEQDRPVIGEIYDRMMEIVNKRTNTVRIQSKKGDVIGSFEKLLSAIV